MFEVHRNKQIPHSARANTYLVLLLEQDRASEPKPRGSKPPRTPAVNWTGKARGIPKVTEETEQPKYLTEKKILNTEPESK